MTKKNNFDILTLVNNNACFDLQFRKDTRHERTNSPTYYRWKAQFIVTVSKDNSKILGKLKKEVNCGKIHNSGNQARFSVQKIDDIASLVIPYLNKNQLTSEKKKDFKLWQKAVLIINKNRGKHLMKWQKNDLKSLIEIHKSSSKYKSNPRKPKWMDVAKTLS